MQQATEVNAVALAFRQQFELIYVTAELNLRGMTPEHSVVQPQPSGNCANWLLAHLIQVQNGVMRLVGEDVVWTDPRLPPIGVPPVRGVEDAFDWEAMCSAWVTSRERCLAAISALTEEALSESVPDPFGGMMTRLELLGVLTNHQPYHIGQLGLVRRLIGLPGVIRGPAEL